MGNFKIVYLNYEYVLTYCKSAKLDEERTVTSNQFFFVMKFQ